LPNTAELKLLRQLQLRINRRTVDFENGRPQGGLDEPRLAEVQRIAGLQKNVANMIREIISRQQENGGGALEFPGADLLKLVE
jgi:hypothetical protein